MSDLTTEQKLSLREIVSAWIGEGFTVPPYTEAQYDLFEWLNLDPGDFDYDIRRPASNRESSAE